MFQFHLKKILNTFVFQMFADWTDCVTDCGVDVNIKHVADMSICTHTINIRQALRVTQIFVLCLVFARDGRQTIRWRLELGLHGSLACSGNSCWETSLLDHGSNGEETPIVSAVRARQCVDCPCTLGSDIHRLGVPTTQHEYSRGWKEVHVGYRLRIPIPESCGPGPSNFFERHCCVTLPAWHPFRKRPSCARTVFVFSYPNFVGALFPA